MGILCIYTYVYVGFRAPKSKILNSFACVKGSFLAKGADTSGSRIKISDFFSGDDGCVGAFMCNLKLS